MTLRIYGDSRSGNCLKVKWTTERLAIPYDWRETDVMTGATRTPELIARVAHEGGFDLTAYPAVKAWVGRTERALGIA